MAETLTTRPVLVVDDDASTRAVVDQYLVLTGLTNPRVHLATGTAAIDDLTRRLEQGTPYLPALMLLDSEMPGATGLEVLRWMRDTPGLSHIPVVLLSGYDSAADVNAAYGLGARSYLVKPVGFEALGGVIRDLELPWLLL